MLLKEALWAQRCVEPTHSHTLTLTRSSAGFEEPGPGLQSCGVHQRRPVQVRRWRCCWGTRSRTSSSPPWLEEPAHVQLRCSSGAAPQEENQMRRAPPTFIDSNRPGCWFCLLLRKSQKKAVNQRGRGSCVSGGPLQGKRTPQVCSGGSGMARLEPR